MVAIINSAYLPCPTIISPRAIKASSLSSTPILINDLKNPSLIMFTHSLAFRTVPSFYIRSPRVTHSYFSSPWRIRSHNQSLLCFVVDTFFSHPTFMLNIINTHYLKHKIDYISLSKQVHHYCKHLLIFMTTQLNIIFL